MMRFSRPLCLSALCLSLALTSCARMNPFHRAQPAAATAAPELPVIGSRKTPRGLLMQISATPDPVKLGENRQIQVIVTLRNEGKNAVNFKFPTSQEIEILLRDPAAGGKTLSAWSADRAFIAQPRVVSLNAKERLEFSEPITTRELKPGKTYSLEAYFVGYEEELRVSRPVIPQP